MAIIYGPNGEVLKKPVESEIATLDKEPFLRITNILPNPDIILRKTGRGPEIYDEMENDDHVWACITTRKSGVASKSWDVLPASDEAKDKEIAEFVKANLLGLNFERDLRQMMDAPFRGFRVHEVIWEERKGKWWVVNLKSKPQRRFNFGADGQLRLITRDNYQGEPVPPFKFMITQHEASDDNPYGVRVFSKMYWPWVFKKAGFKFWAIFIEKFGMPLLLGRYRQGASQDEIDKIIEALANMVQDAVGAVPQGTTVDTLEAKSGKEGSHQAFLTYCDNAISKAALGQTLTTQIGSTGSYAAAGIHYEVKQEIVEADARMIMASINNQLVKWLVDFNFGPQERYPEFKIFYEPEEVKKDLAERDERLVNMGVPIGVNYFYSRYNIPAPDKNEQLVSPRNSAHSPQFTGDSEKDKDFSRPDQDADFDEKIMIARGTRLDQLYRNALGKGKKAWGGLMADIRKQISRWESYDDVDSLQVDPEKLDLIFQVLMDTVRVGYMLGELDAVEDYNNAFLDFAEDKPYTIKPEPLSFEEAIEKFKNLMPVEVERYRKLDEELKPKFFTISRVEGSDIVAKIKSYIEESIEKGTPFEEFKKNVDDLFDRMGIGETNPWHLETVFRTNIQTAYNAGNWEKMNTPEFVDMFPFYRYSAILDSQTRPSHRAMHGFTARRDDPVWDEWWPPNGYRCRCGIIAINKFRAAREGITLSPATNIPVPDQGFTKNPGRALREVPDSIKDRADFIAA